MRIRTEIVIYTNQPSAGRSQLGQWSKLPPARDQMRTREGQVAEMDRVPVDCAALVGRILAHRCNHDAIAQFKRTNFIRREQ
jgi:hypothetical protein